MTRHTVTVDDFIRPDDPGHPANDDSPPIPPDADAEPGRRWLDWLVYATWFGLGAGVVWLVGRWG